MQHHWIKWFNGYLIIILKGKRMERLINLAISKRMQIWQIARFDEQRGKMAIRVEDFLRLKPILKETGCRVEIISKHGFPFFLRTIKKRYAFFGGFIAFVAMLFLLSHMILSVEVVGTDKVSKTKVLEISKKLGIEQGEFTFMLDDPDKIQSELMKQIPEASWIGFQIKGTKAQIRVVEKVIPDERETVGPRNLVAKKSAIIRSIFASKGKPVVRPNDFVKKGDILVSGLIGKVESPVAVAAKGKVEGEVWYDTEVVVPTVQKRLVYTGESHRNYYLSVFGHPIKVWGFGDIPFKQYETKQDHWEWTIRNIKIPFSWTREVLLANQVETVKLNEKQIQTLAEEAAKQDILSKMGNGGYIKVEKVLHQRQENDKVYIKMHVIAIEDIAVEQPINAEGE